MLQEFNLTIKDKNWSENLIIDDLSRPSNKEITNQEGEIIE